MKLVIQEPRWYLSAGDEDYFFEWLKSISAVKDIVPTRAGLLELTLADPVDDPSLRELLALSKRYGLDMKPLRNLLTPENEHWFAGKKKAYWYRSVFKAEPK
jgi:hypothetical protein